jgi:hypothetical protein
LVEKVSVKAKLISQYGFVQRVSRKIDGASTEATESLKSHK